MDAQSSCCPTCGQPLAPDTMQWDEVARTFVGGGKSARFTASEANFFNELWKARRRGGFPDMRTLADAVYAKDINGGPDSWYDTAGVVLFNIRRKLKEIGFTVPYARGNPKQALRIMKIAEAA